MTAATRGGAFLIGGGDDCGALAGFAGGSLHKLTLDLLFFCQIGSLLFYHKNRAKCRFHCTKHEADAQGLFCGERTTAGGSPRRCGLFFFAAQQQYQGKRKGTRWRISLRRFG
jgi:hypothetical protein